MKVGLKLKLMASFVVLVAVPVVILGYFSFNMAADSLQETIEQQLQSNTKQTAEAIDNTLKSTEKILQIISKNTTLAKAASGLEPENRMTAFHYLQDVQKENSDLLETLIITDGQGKAIMDNSSFSSEVDLSRRSYIKTALNGTTGVSDVIISKITGEPVVAIGQPLFSDGETVGVVIGTIKFENISEHAAKVKIGNSGYAYMIDKTGLFVYHPKAEKILLENIADTENTELKALVSQMQAGEAGEGFYTYEGVYKYVTFQPAGNWVLAITANYNDYMSAALEIKKNTLMIIGVALIVALSLAFMITNNIIKPLRQLQELMIKAGNGDLTVKANIKTKDEIRELGESFNKMMVSQAEIVGQVRKGSLELAASSQELAASSEQVSSATQQISASIQQVAKDADEQNNSVIEASQSLVQLSSLVQLAQNKAYNINQGSENTMQTAQMGRTKVQDTVQAMDTINVKSHETSNVVQELNQLSAKVGEIITTINTIAD